MVSDSGSYLGAGIPYTAFVGGPYQCWKGDISGVNFFGNSVGFQSRPDYADLQPCCSMADRWLANGISLSVATPNILQQPVK